MDQFSHLSQHFDELTSVTSLLHWGHLCSVSSAVLLSRPVLSIIKPFDMNIKALLVVIGILRKLEKMVCVENNWLTILI